MVDRGIGIACKQAPTLGITDENVAISPLKMSTAKPRTGTRNASVRQTSPTTRSDHENCCHHAPAGLVLRIAASTDAELLSEFVRELAEFGGLSHECAITPAAVTEHLLGPRRCTGAIIAELDGKPAGCAVYYRTFSTFAAKPGIFLEDLYVRPDFRKRGLGRALLALVIALSRPTEPLAPEVPE